MGSLFLAGPQQTALYADFVEVTRMDFCAQFSFFKCWFDINFSA